MPSPVYSYKVVDILRIRQTNNTNGELFRTRFQILVDSAVIKTVELDFPTSVSEATMKAEMAAVVSAYRSDISAAAPVDSVASTLTTLKTNLVDISNTVP